jgi:sigma-E factor negative regulatory protein RseA
MNKSTIGKNLHPEWEALSSLVDGELDPAAADSLLTALCRDAELRNEWVTLHIVGDALRSSEVAAVHSTSFCARVAAALESEPTVLAPRPPQANRSGTLRRYLAPGVAIAASAAVIAFVAVPLLQSPATVAPSQQVATTAVPIAAVPSASEVSRRAAATVANARAFDVYLAAHRELASGVALPRATPYLRTPGDAPEGR